MIRYLLFILVFLLLASCINQSQPEEAILESVTNSKNQEALQGEVVRLVERKAFIDTLISHNKLQVEVLVQQPDSEKLIVVVNEEFPEEVERTFNIWRDSDGRIVFIGEYPYSESGDWYIEYKHYFNEAGETFAFERITNFFNSICTDGVAREVILDFYDSNFRKLHQVYSLTDMDANKLNKEECGFPYDYPYVFSQSLDSYVEMMNYLRK
jgi:hypothetical protein